MRLGKFNTGKRIPLLEFVNCLSLVDENFLRNDEDTSVLNEDARSEVYFWISLRLRQIEHSPARLKILGIEW